MLFLFFFEAMSKVAELASRLVEFVQIKPNGFFVR